MNPVPSSSPRVGSPVRRLALLASGLWWGGLTVYALIVVPIGSELLGAREQGLVTQQVTNWLNGLAGLMIAASAGECWASRRRSGGLTTLLLLLTLLVLLALHWQLDSLLLLHPHEETLDPRSFYRWHQAYLWVTTLQWLTGLVHFWQLAGAAPIATAAPVGTAAR